MPSGDGGKRSWLRRWRSVRVVVTDESMQPTLRPGDRLLVEHLGSKPAAPAVGDVVAVRDPEAPPRWLVKRIAAVGPARLFVTRVGVAVGQGAGPWEAPPDAVEEREVPSGSVFVVSDAAPYGRDSRAFGPVPVDDIVGVAWWRYAPRDVTGPIVRREPAAAPAKRAPTPGGSAGNRDAP